MECKCEWKSEWVTERDSVEVRGQENQCGWEKCVWRGRQGENDKGREWVSEWLSDSGREKICKLRGDWLIERLRVMCVHYRRQKGCRWFSQETGGWKLMFSQRYYEKWNYSVVSRCVVGCVVPYLISNFRRVLYVAFFLLGNSPASEFYMPTFRNTLSVPSL